MPDSGPRREVLTWDSSPGQVSTSCPLCALQPHDQQAPAAGTAVGDDHTVCAHQTTGHCTCRGTEDREHVTHSPQAAHLLGGQGTTTRVLGFGNRLSTLVLEAHPRRVRIKATSSAGFSSPRKELNEVTAATLTGDHLPRSSGRFCLHEK